MKLKTPSKPSSNGKPAPAAPKGEAMHPTNEKRHPGSMPTSIAAAPIGMSDERKSVYEAYNEGVASGELTPPPSSDEEPNPGPETTETSTETEVTEVAPEEATKAEETPSDVVEEEAPPSEDTKHTTVPHAALHEERENHKETKAKLKELMDASRQASNELQVLMEENERLKKGTATETKKDEPADDAPIDDIEKEIRTLRVGIREANARNKRLENILLEDKQSEAETKFNRAVGMVAEELQKEGFPGFDKFRHLVAEKIEKRAKGDPLKVRALDNPVGWAEVYRSEVYPEIAGVFGVKVKEAKKEEKETLKGKANLITVPGKAPVKPAAEEKKPWGLTDYFKMRQEKRPS